MAWNDKNDETVEVELHVHAVTMKAMLLSPDGVERNAEWTPKSQIVSGKAERDKVGTFELKEWIAKKNGFI
jgi:hypothetical protein